jgi:hypothetical protein
MSLCYAGLVVSLRDFTTVLSIWNYLRSVWKDRELRAAARPQLSFVPPTTLKVDHGPNSTYELQPELFIRFENRSGSPWTLRSLHLELRHRKWHRYQLVPLKEVSLASVLQQAGNSAAMLSQNARFIDVRIPEGAITYAILAKYRLPDTVAPSALVSGYSLRWRLQWTGHQFQLLPWKINWPLALGKLDRYTHISPSYSYQAASDYFKLPLAAPPPPAVRPSQPLPIEDSLPQRPSQESRGECDES